MSGAGPIAVYLVDKRPLWRIGLRVALEQDNGFEVVGEAAEHAFADDRPPHCDVLVTSWPVGGATQRPASLRRLPTLALCREGADAAAGLSALRAGAAACLYDHVEARELRAAVRLVYEGGCVIDPTFAAAVSAEIHGGPPAPPELTAAEVKVAGHISRGLTNREIATQTGMPERTVVAVISALLQKLGLPSRSAVAAWWIRRGGGQGA